MTWQQTYSGRVVETYQPDPLSIDPIDIAHALSFQCRFNGHCRRFYSVAEHCVTVSKIVSPEAAAWGLLHDAHEAYIGDIPSPIKREIGADRIKELERRYDMAILKRFGLNYPSEAVLEEVHRVDGMLLMTERDILCASPPMSWGDYLENLPRLGYDLIKCMEPASAKIAFWQRMIELNLEMT